MQLIEDRLRLENQFLVSYGIPGFDPRDEKMLSVGSSLSDYEGWGSGTPPASELLE